MLGCDAIADFFQDVTRGRMQKGAEGAIVDVGETRERRLQDVAGCRMSYLYFFFRQWIMYLVLKMWKNVVFEAGKVA